MEKIKKLFFVLTFFMLTSFHGMAQATKQTSDHKAKAVNQPVIKKRKNNDATKFYDAIILQEEGSKPLFECEQCIFSTGHISRINAHNKAHVLQEIGGKIIHQCDNCGYLTDRRQSLISHIEAHQNEKPYRCKVKNCRFKANRIFSLERHMSSQHWRRKVN